MPKRKPPDDPKLIEDSALGRFRHHSDTCICALCQPALYHNPEEEVDERQPPKRRTLNAAPRTGSLPTPAAGVLGRPRAVLH